MSDILDDMKWQVVKYRTDKILSGRGLEDDPEWVGKFKEVISAHDEENC